MSSEITYISQKLHRLKIKKYPKKKKYLINQDTRDFLKTIPTQTLGIIPFQVKTNPIYNHKKEFFLNYTHILVNHNSMIYIPCDKSETQNPKEKITSYLSENLNIEISEELVNKILDVENSKILIYTINLTDITLSVSEKQNNTCNINEQMKNLKLEEKNKFKLVSTLDFYTEVKFQKSKKELYQNILEVRQNKYHLHKCIPLTISPNHTIQFTYHFIYQRLFGY